MPKISVLIITCVLILLSSQASADPIINKNSNKCLAVDGASTASGANVSQYDCSGESNQDWVAIPVGAGFSLQVAHSGQCLDVSGVTPESGASLVQWPCHGGGNQVFTWVGEALQASHSSKCVAIVSNSTASGANAQQESCDGSDAQSFSNVVSANELTMCDEVSSSLSSGTLFDSGGRTGKYANNESCNFLIQPSANHDITLSFSEFDYENFFD
jgi:hypothetical protein